MHTACLLQRPNEPFERLSLDLPFAKNRMLCTSCWLKMFHPLVFRKATRHHHFLWTCLQVIVLKCSTPVSLMLKCGYLSRQLSDCIHIQETGSVIHIYETRKISKSTACDLVTSFFSWKSLVLDGNVFHCSAVKINKEKTTYHVSF